MSGSERRGSGEGLWAIAPEDVRDWHREGWSIRGGASHCSMCKQEWPCDTVIVLADRDRRVARVAELEAAIREVLADEETGTGWGPDITMALRLKEVLEAKP